MVTCGRKPFNMLPMAPINPFVVGLSPSVAAAAAAATVTSTTTVPSSPTLKPRIAFSIDSIVGGKEGECSKARRVQQRPVIISPSLSSSQRSESPDIARPERSPSNSYSEDLQHCQTHGLELRNSELPQRGVIFCRRRVSLDRSPERECLGSPSPRRSRSRSPLTYSHQQERTPSNSPNRRSSTPLPPHSTHLAAVVSSAVQPASTNKGPIIVPGIPAGLLRPLPIQPPNLALVSNATGSNETGVLSSPIPPIGGAAPPPPPHLTGHPHGSLHTSQGPPPPGAPPPNPHFLAAQFQMAAALAHHHHQQQQQQHPGAHLPPGHPMGIFPPSPHHPHFGGPHHQLIRDSYPLYPWLLSRHGRIFPHRFPGNFLLQPFRKPKRVRTAFSPTQLLKLEHAFEGNHYVVGAERKQLAQALSLTETQVKVWFQNRRTKHKRMQQEDGDNKSNKGSQAGDAEGKNDSSQNSFEDQEDEEDEEDIEDEDEVIDMDDYGSEMDSEEHQRIREQFQQQLQQHHQQMQQHMQQSQQQQQQQQQQNQHREQQQQQQQLLQQHHQQQHQQFLQQQQYLMQQQQQQQKQQ